MSNYMNKQNFLGIDFNTPLQGKSPFTNVIILIMWLFFSYIVTKIAKYLDKTVVTS